MDTNELFLLAERWINHTNQHIFLTGKAGTGKTTFLKHIQAHTHKQTAVLAPTGVAAINAGGSTIHSFFKLPFTLFVPEQSHGSSQPDNVLTPRTLLQHLRYSRQQVHLLNSLELLIIDEISMVRVDMIDMLDTILRKIRNQPLQPFGGVQMLFIGDMYQLPPVVKSYEMPLLSSYYASPYFFDSMVLKEHPPICIELQHVYRQEEPHFLNLLNELRINEVSEDSYHMLLEKVVTEAPANNKFITLSSHIATADEINRKGLLNLFTPAKIFHAEVAGDFPASQYPAAAELELKEGARVMFIKNDPERRFYNGKMATVTKIIGEDLWVRCDEDEQDMQVTALTWELTKYSVHQGSGDLKTDVVGTFTQIPLRHAWAVTIHKSQGLSFDNVIIDAGKSFASGQVYVALSRCRSWKGVVLLSQIKPAALFSDLNIVNFSSTMWKVEKLQTQFPNYQIQFQLEAIQEAFDLDKFIHLAARIERTMHEGLQSFSAAAITFLQRFLADLSTIASLAAKFRNQIQQLHQAQVLPFDNEDLGKRIHSAASYFSQEINQKIIASLHTLPAAPDNIALGTKLLTHLTEIREISYKRKHVWELLAQDRNLENLFIGKKNALLALSKMQSVRWGKNLNAASLNPFTQYHQLEEDLRQWRQMVANAKKKPVYTVISNQAIDAIVAKPPSNEKQLRALPGIGDKKLAQYGMDILDIVSRYKDLDDEDQLELTTDAPSLDTNKKKSKQDKIPSQHLTHQLLLQGKTVAEVAKERGYVESTIYSHIAKLITEGLCSATEFLSKEQIALIRQQYQQLPEDNKSITALKEKLLDAFDFGQLRIALASVEASSTIQKSQQ